ncbi:hypothetical protein LELG_00505 [Lodderomyces elongisporus NRRL YB-4239]|uniref:SH3 domain-containing protein n=1 Tax=Lodderomyces elongisporus (strain ATCC 11503 / CBS 2605 / JCM 1781 / NBRC 1676 / NRRL YB-4239) TaxID=379508 RepID=A5DT19_LODEL|nr:hypothetical protein LELG_00505 [Lodderomyces elongisporus NRRL YB-4239]
MIISTAAATATVAPPPPPQQQRHTDHLLGDKYSSKAQGLTRTFKTLKISGPKTKEEITTDLKSNIILAAKFPFDAESSNELSIKTGDILKLLATPKDGWILVKYIDRLHTPGLIPASYVDIVVNDPVHPITLNWLHSQDTYSIINDHKYLDLQFNKVESKFQTINNRAYPTSASIPNFFLYKKRYWYRLDIEYSDKSTAHVCRYYQDFYNLHIDLLDLVENVGKKDSADAKTLKLPKLPEPIPTNTKSLTNAEEEKTAIGSSNDSNNVNDKNNNKDNNIDRNNDQGSHNDSVDEKARQRARIEDELQEVTMLLKRCNDLNIYTNKLILNKYLQTSKQLVDWLSTDYKDLPGFCISEEELLHREENDTILSNDEINEKLLPGSINVVKDFNEKKLKLQEELEREAKAKEEELKKQNRSDIDGDHEAEDLDELTELADEDLPARSKSKNIYNNYQQASHVFSSARQPSLKLNSPRLNRSDSKSATNQGVPTQGAHAQNSRKHSQASLAHTTSFSSNSSSSPTDAAPIRELPVSTPDTSIDSAYNSSFTQTPKLQQFSMTLNPFLNGQKTASSTTPVAIKKQQHPQQQQQQQHHHHHPAVPETAHQSSQMVPPGPYNHPMYGTPPKGSPKLINTNIASPKMHYSPKPGLPPQVNTSQSPLKHSPKTFPIPPQQYQYQQQHSPSGQKSHPQPFSPLNQGMIPLAPNHQQMGSNNPFVYTKGNGVNSTSTSGGSGSGGNGGDSRTPPQNLKCKISNFNNETFAIILNKAQIKSVQDLKISVKQRVYYTKLFIKLPNLNNYENIDIVKFNITEFLRFNDEVALRIS